MLVLDDFASGDVGRALALLSPEEHARLEARASVRGDKLHLKCWKREKVVRATPEEIVRQLWLDRLVHEYGVDSC